MRRVPRNLMVHRMDVYLATVSAVSGAQESSFGAEPDYQAVPCNIQPALSTVVTDYGRQDEIVSHSIFLIDGEVFGAVKVADQIEIDGVRYEKRGSMNLVGLNRVYRIDVKEVMQ